MYECARIAGPKLPRRSKKMIDYVQRQNNTLVDGLNSTGEVFHHMEIFKHYQELCFETVDILVTNITDRFDQHAVKVLSDIE